MTSFYCEQCGVVCTDSPGGYTTGCEHYPPDVEATKLPAPRITAREAIELLNARNRWERYQSIISPFED